MVTKGGCFIWEYETLFDSLEDDNCLPTSEGRDRLMAGIASLINPRFLWDAGAFMTLCQTFNGKLAIPEIWEPQSPGSLCLGLQEINSLYHLYQGAEDITPLFAEEPKIFIAGCCRDYGLAKPPSNLEVVSDQLERFYERRQDLKEEVTSPLFNRISEEIDTYLKAINTIRKENLSHLKKVPT